MAYLSKKDITGTVICNIYAEQGKIVDSTENKDGYIKTFNYAKLSSNCTITKFSQYSIKYYEFCVFLNDMTNLVGSNIDFTFSQWCYPYKQSQSDASGGQQFVGFGNMTGSSSLDHTYIVGVYGLTLNSLEFGYSYGNTFLESNAGFANSWNHVALTKKGNVVYYFINGVLKTSKSIDSLFFDNTASEKIYLYSRLSNDQTNPGIEHMDDFVFISGQCLWTSNFTPPTEPLIGDMKHKHILYQYDTNENKNSTIKIQ